MPTVTLRIPPALRALVGGRAEVRVEARSVAGALARLSREEPRLAARILGDDGTPRGYVNLYLDGRDLRELPEADRMLEEDAEIRIVPSIAGGAAEVVLSAGELRRYHRQMILPSVGEAGQRRLREAAVLVVGAGGLGSPAATYLAAAGVGRLGIVDHDVVELSNLHRQPLHATADLGRPKAESARDRLRALNPEVEVRAIAERIDSGNAARILADYDLVVDGSDNFPTRYLLNDACVLYGLPLVYGAIFRFEGQASLFAAPGGPCYRCLFREPPPPEAVPSCAEAGVLGVLPGIVGAVQGAEAIRWILGIGESLRGRLLLIDALGMEFREIALRRDPECAVCGDAPEVRELIDYEAFCRGGAEPAAAEAAEPQRRIAGETPEIDPAELERRLRGTQPPQLLDVREPYEWKIASLEAEGARLVPLRELPDRLAELDARRETVVYCHTGSRSALAVQFLRQAGFEATNLRGGIDAWSREVDSSVPTY